MATTTRNELKLYFQKGKIPTQAHFEALIDSGLNQLDDRVRSSPNDPLMILPSGRNAGLMGFARLEATAGGETIQPTWLIRHEPPDSPAPGLLFHDAQRKSMLYLQAGTGQVGIGTVTPDRPLTLQPPVGSLEWLSFKNAAGATKWHFNHQAGGLNLAETGVADGRFYIAAGGDVGIGTVDPKARLQVVGGAIMPSAGQGDDAGIVWPPDPFGGSGDRAWIRYHNRRGGEKTTLEIGVTNDGDDHIVLNPSGNVGIGVAAPEAKLHVDGDIRLADARTVTSGARLHISSGELLYLLPKSGVVIGKEWGGTGDLTVQGMIKAGGSAIYFTDTEHNHSGLGNTIGHAAIENSRDFGCLMILGRQVSPNPRLAVARVVKVWDQLHVIGAFVNNSDLREKQEVMDLEYGLREIRQLRPVSFNWRALANPHKSLGLIAQEVEPVLREVVYPQGGEAHDRLGISYVNLIPVLVNAIKELAGQVDHLRSQATA